MSRRTFDVGFQASSVKLAYGLSDVNKDILWHVSYSMPPFRRNFTLRFPDAASLVWIGDYVREHHVQSHGIVFDEERETIEEDKCHCHSI